MLQEIAKFIADNTALLPVPFVVGTNLFEGHRLQDAPDRCTCILETGGGGLHFDLPDRVDKMIQVLSRAKSYFDARSDAMDIFNTLHKGIPWEDGTYSGGTAGHILTRVPPATQDYIAMTIEAVSDPQYIGQDEKRRCEFSTNYIFRIRNA